MHFALEMGWSQTGRLWHEQIDHFIRGEIPRDIHAVLDDFGVSWSRDLSITYLVDRVGQETMKFGSQYGTAQLDRAIGEISCRRSGTAWSKR
jgi:hypothetical protein